MGSARSDWRCSSLSSVVRRASLLLLRLPFVSRPSTRPSFRVTAATSASSLGCSNDVASYAVQATAVRVLRLGVLSQSMTVRVVLNGVVVRV